MAQLDPMQRYGNNARSPTITPTVEQLLRAADAEAWTPSAHASSPVSARSQDVLHDPEDVHYQPKKLTVLAKVKEKARRWRNSFTKRKQGEGDNTTPSWGVRLEDDDCKDEDPEYLGAPMYESELAPEDCKENARQHPRAYPVISEKHVLPSSDRFVDEAEAKKPAPVDSTATNAIQMIASKIQGLSISAQRATESNKPATSKSRGHGTQETEKHALQTDTPLSPRENNWDKGVSVREYIRNKFEPGEDEKALSQVISDAISPRRATGDVGVIEKVKGAVNSFLRGEEPTQSTIEHSAANSSLPRIAISNNAQADTKEDITGRILQANER